MKGNCDMSNVPDQFELLPEAEYEVVLMNYTDQKTKDNSDLINVEFEITEGDFRGRKLWDNFVIKENALWRLKMFLKALDLPHKGQINFDSDDWINKPLKVKVYHDEYNGKKRSKISDYLSSNKKIDNSDPSIPF